MSIAKVIAGGVKRNSSPILVGVNIALGGYACFLTGKAAVKAYKAVQKEKPKSRKELIKTTWKYFIPPAIAFAGSAASAVTGAKINARKQAALASAAAISETALEGVTKHMSEELTGKKAESIIDKALQENADANLPKSEEIIDTGKGETLIQDSITGQWARTDCEAIRAARNSANDSMNKDGYVDFNLFLEEAGFNVCDIGDELGWSAMNDGLFDVNFVGGAAPYNGEPYLIIKYSPRPVLGPWE